MMISLSEQSLHREVGAHAHPPATRRDQDAKGRAHRKTEAKKADLEDTVNKLSSKVDQAVVTSAKSKNDGHKIKTAKVKKRHQAEYEIGFATGLFLRSAADMMSKHELMSWRTLIQSKIAVPGSATAQLHIAQVALHRAYELRWAELPD